MTPYDVRMEEIRFEAARKISTALDAHLEHIKGERLYPYNVVIVESAARITECLANALSVMTR